jgi:hypothetical protein
MSGRKEGMKGRNERKEGRKEGRTMKERKERKEQNEGTSLIPVLFPSYTIILPSVL